MLEGQINDLGKTKGNGTIVYVTFSTNK